MHIDWDNTMVTGISGIKIDMPSNAKVSIFTDNDLTHINDDHFKINLVARLLNQIYIAPVPPPDYDYDNLHANVLEEQSPSTSTGVTASAPPFFSPHECIFYINTVMYNDFIYIYRMIFEVLTHVSFVLLNYDCNLTACY